MNKKAQSMKGALVFIALVMCFFGVGFKKQDCCGACFRVTEVKK